MATFTFAAGNTRALLRLPLYLLGFLASLVVPRVDELWVIGSGAGLGEGALPLYRRARATQSPDVRVVWLASSDAELAAARALGLDAVSKTGRAGLWLTLRARVLVVTHGAGDVNRYGARGGFLVQLWHGIPLKKLHLDSPVAASARIGGALAGRLLRRMYRVAGGRISLFPVASARIVDRISSAFGLPADRIAVTGDPRDDVLLDGPAEQRRREARERLETQLGPLPPNLILYAPTWRDGAPDPSAPDEATWAQIATWLVRRDAALVVRNHPLGKGDYAVGPRRSERVKLLDSRAVLDVNTVLNAIDVLVTDYSSIAFDFALIDGPAVFLAPDVAAYTKTRGLYEPYASFSGGRAVTTWSAVLERLDVALAGDPELAAHTAWLRAEHFDFRDAGATDRVLAEIERRAAGGGAAAAPRAPVRVVRARAAGATLQLAIEPAPQRARLTGPRGEVADHDGFDLLATRWGVGGLSLPTGDYRLTLDDNVTRVDVAAPLPTITHELFRAQPAPADGGLVVRIAPPVDRVGAAAYRRSRPAPENAVFFESFYGRTVADNPLGIDWVLAREHPDVTRYWSVADGSIAVPDGAVRIVERSAEWWRVRAAARLLVVNDWLRWPYRRRAHQHVLQTWHGTMLKRLAADRPDVTPRKRLAVWREQRRWDALLAQNAYSAEIFRSAYLVRGPIWITGYPRNDGFADPARAARIRARLGLAEDTRAVLYAPTWRDDRDELVDHLEPAALAQALPSDHVLLVRGHSRTLGFGGDLHGERLLDVTSYPDVADLMQVADVLVTDYSSVMFDFAATGKPIVFHVPDLEHYGEQLRGFYFDLLAQAPGPVARTPAEVREAVLAPQLDAARYAAWRDKFVPYDDGRAGERVVERIYAEGWLG